MAQIIADNGLVSSWAGTGNSALISGGSAPYEFTLTGTKPEADVTPFVSGGTAFRQFALGLGEWSAAMSTRLSPVKYGSGGLVTASAAYTTNVRSWRMSIAATPAEKSTVMNATPPTWQTYVPNLVQWSGTYEAFVDDTTALVFPTSTAESITFKLVENASADHTLSGSCLIQQLSAPIRIGSISVATYSFRGTGTLTAAGTSGSGVGAPLFAAGALTKPAVGSLVLQAASGRTYTGDAFWESIDIDCVVDEVINVTINAKGTGALTIA